MPDEANKQAETRVAEYPCLFLLHSIRRIFK